MQNSKNNLLILKDSIFGNFIIDSSVLIEIINSKPLQRLKKISLYGPPKEYYHLKDNPSRFLHSIQVMLLLKKLGASEEEQIAGLTHDISHTTFSHVIDCIWGDMKTDGFQDSQHKSFLEKSEISEILKKYNYNPEKIAEHNNFSLLEQEIPELCADRIGYSLREFPKKDISFCLENLTVKNGKIVFKNKKSATVFAKNFLKRQMENWGGFEAVARYAMLAYILKIALKEKIIKENDFWEYDNFVVKKIKSSKNKEILRVLKLLKRNSLKKLPLGKEVMHKKFRHVDPLFIFNKNLIKLSSVDKDFKKELEEAKALNKRGIILPDFG